LNACRLLICATQNANRKQTPIIIVKLLRLDRPAYSLQPNDAKKPLIAADER
jgi:hypothetical protein